MFSSGSQPSSVSRSTFTAPLPVGHGHRTFVPGRFDDASSPPSGDLCREQAADESIRRFQEHGDAQALRAVMAAYDWVAVSCARQMQRRGEPLEDLEQVAREALIGAASRFDFDRGVPFKSFAWVTAMGALRHHYRSQWQVRVPRALQEFHLKTVRAVAELTAAGICEPTVRQLATFMNVSPDEIVTASDVKHAYLSASLDHRLEADGNGASDRVLGDIDEAIESTADRVILQDMLKRLPSEQRHAIVMHFFEGRTQAEVGATLGVSQVQVSRLLRSALDVLRGQLGGICVNTSPSLEC